MRTRTLPMPTLLAHTHRGSSVLATQPQAICLHARRDCFVSYVYLTTEIVSVYPLPPFPPAPRPHAPHSHIQNGTLTSSSFNSLSFITPTPSHFLSLPLVFSVIINNHSHIIPFALFIQGRSVYNGTPNSSHECVHPVFNTIYQTIIKTIIKTIIRTSPSPSPCR